MCVRARAPSPLLHPLFLAPQSLPAVPKTPTGRVGTGQAGRRRVGPPASRGLVDFLGDAVGLPQSRWRQRWPPLLARRVGRARRGPSQQGSGPLPCVTAWPSARWCSPAPKALVDEPFGRPPRIDSTALGPRIGPPFPAPRRLGFEPGPAVCRRTGQRHAHPSPGPCDGSSPLKAGERCPRHPLSRAPGSLPGAPPPTRRPQRRRSSLALLCAGGQGRAC